jgi:hypothetical protein
VTFGQTVRLVGWEVAVADAQGIYQPASAVVKEGQSVRVSLWWQAAARIPADYTVFVHALDSGGQVAGQHDSPPAYGFRPSSQWVGQEIVRDLHYFELSKDASEFEIGLYDVQTGVRLESSMGTAAVRFAVGK